MRVLSLALISLGLLVWGAPASFVLGAGLMLGALFLLVESL
jgi:hypothetical protein